MSTYLTRIMHIVESKHGKLSAEELAAIIILADAAEEAEERRVVAEEAAMPLLSVERIEDGWLVTAKDDNGKPFRTAFVRSPVSEDDRDNWDRMMRHFKDVLFPDFDGDRMEVRYVSTKTV
jgi:protease II